MSEEIVIPDIFSLDVLGDYFVFEIRNEIGNRIYVRRKIRVPNVYGPNNPGRKALIDILEEFKLKAVRIEKGDVPIEEDLTTAIIMTPGYIVYTKEIEPEDLEETPF